MRFFHGWPLTLGRDAIAAGVLASALALTGAPSLVAAQTESVDPASDGPLDSATEVPVLPDDVDPDDDSEDDETGIGELPPFDSFDIDTTTDTEVDRIGDEVAGAQLQAVISDLATAADLANRQAELRRREQEQADAEAALVVIEDTLQAAAINGFVTDNSASATDLVAESLDNLANESLADYTTNQLLINRQLAEDELDQAIVAVERSEFRLEAAENRKYASAVAVEAATNNLDVFEERAAQHAAAAARADRASAALSDEVDLASVAGVLNVNAEIEEEIDRLIADARADGLNLSGGGYRTIEAQIALRLAHCGGGIDMEAPGPEATPEELAAYESAVAAAKNYAIYEAPASSCSPPTAVPGQSEHQSGLAVDFTLDGSILTWDSPGFFWLVENGAEYGLINLPSEAWHWSTTGS